MVKQSLKSGLITGTATALLIAGIFFFWDQLGLVWPVAFVPVFATGVYALHRCGAAITGARRAVLAGAVAGSAAAVVSLLAVIVVTMLAEPRPPRPYPYWNLVLMLMDTPWRLPADRVFYDLPGLLPFPWFLRRVLRDGTQVSRIPWTLILWLPAGALLAGLQAYLYHGLARQVNFGAWAVSRIATSRSGYHAKLLAGFIILSVLIFMVGWLGWASTEEMHTRVHRGRATQHWLDHTVHLQENLRAQGEARARLANAPAPAGLQEVSELGQKITAELAHLKAVPPPQHSIGDFGTIGASLVREAEKRLPAVREADSRINDLNKATQPVVEFYRAGNRAEAQALLATLPPLQGAVETPLRELANDLHTDIAEWMGEVDAGAHVQQYLMMLLVLLASGVAFPLGHVFSRVVVQPVNEVGKGLERIGAGDFHTRVEVENKDELGELAQRVNQMGGELTRLYEELRGLNENLQQKVAEQLQEIEHARELKRYLSPQLAESILSGTVSVDLVSSRKNLTVFFSDIRGFTALSERMEPEELVDLLNEYLTLMTDIVFKHGGTLDKYIGDSIMVFFGDPIPYQNHAERAVLMALEMKAQLGTLQKRWFAEKEELLTIGMGVTTGYVTVGNIGSPARLDYTVIGNQVNLASRLADMAEPGQILVAERTLLAVRDLVDATEISEVTLQGVSRPVKVYEINEKSAGPLTALAPAS